MKKLFCILLAAFLTINLSAQNTGIHQQHSVAPAASIFAPGMQPVICSNSPAYVGFIAQGNFNADNIFNMQISDMNGSFSNPLIAGSVAGTGPGTIITDFFSLNLPTGSNYIIRIVSTDPVVTGASSVPFTLLASPSVPTIQNSGGAVLCQGATETLSTGSYYAYQWSNGQTTQDITVGPVNYYYSVTVTNPDGCSATSAPLYLSNDQTPLPNIATLRKSAAAC